MEPLLGLLISCWVPQATVLKPLLFLLHIDDLPGELTLQLRVFADDCFMCDPIHSIADHVERQSYLSALERWEGAWGMGFNTFEFQVMHIRKPHNTTAFFVQFVMETKYVGVTLTHKLSWSRH